MGGSFIMIGTNANINYNSETLCDKLYLCSDGINVRVQSMKQHKVKRVPISQLRPMSKEQLKHILDNEE